MIIDISPTISEKTAVWPGDVKFSRTIQCSINSGANIDLSSMNTTLHIGSHVDAPSHYAKNSTTVDKLALDPYIGPCQVIRLKPSKERLIQVHEIEAKIQAKRVLIYTGSFPSHNNFNEDFRAFSPETIDYLADRGVMLIGIDTPSFDLFESKDLASHKKLWERKVCNLEGIILKDVDEGLYELIALPLKIEDADASPVRAILRSL